MNFEFNEFGIEFFIQNDMLPDFQKEFIKFFENNILYVHRKVSILRLCRSAIDANNITFIKHIKKLKPITNDNKRELFEYSCLKGNLDIAQWIFFQEGINADDRKVFKYVCYNGHLEVAKWLFSLNSIEINNDDLIRSCADGHLNIVKWILSIGVNMDVDEAFGYACENGHLEIAGWLYSRGAINIHIDNDLAFRFSCQKGHLGIARWLCTLYLGYKIQVIDNKIEYTIN